jgi:ubiquinone/menaquinone biosynthesis C-methylase UbiE
MDSWKYYDIIHRYHALMNPVDDEKFNDLIDLLQLPPAARVTDIGCGKGEMLIRLAEKYGIRGIGVDKSPYCIREAKKRKNECVAQADLQFLEMNGSDYKPETVESEDLTMCIGASWIYGGYKNTLKALSRMTKPHGHLMVGEPFWRKTPPQAYLRSAKLSRRSFNTHEDNVTTGESMGLAPVYALVSTESDWDRYEGLHWYATQEYANSHPQDPDLKDILAHDAKGRESYLKHERDILGWAVYLFQKKI